MCFRFLLRNSKSSRIIATPLLLSDGRSARGRMNCDPIARSRSINGGRMSCDRPGRRAKSEYPQRSHELRPELLSALEDPHRGHCVQNPDRRLCLLDSKRSHELRPPLCTPSLHNEGGRIIATYLQAAAEQSWWLRRPHVCGGPCTRVLKQARALA